MSEDYANVKVVELKTTWENGEMKRTATLASSSNEDGGHFIAGPPYNLLKGQVLKLKFKWKVLVEGSFVPVKDDPSTFQFGTLKFFKGDKCNGEQMGTFTVGDEAKSVDIKNDDGKKVCSVSGQNTETATGVIIEDTQDLKKDDPGFTYCFSYTVNLKEGDEKSTYDGDPVMVNKPPPTGDD